MGHLDKAIDSLIEIKTDNGNIAKKAKIAEMGRPGASMFCAIYSRMGVRFQPTYLQCDVQDKVAKESEFAAIEVEFLYRDAKRLAGELSSANDSCRNACVS